MENDQIRSAFSKVKQDMQLLSEEVASLRNEIEDIKIILESINNKLDIERVIQQTNLPLNTTIDSYPTDRQTFPQEIGGLKSQNLNFSTGNEGVPTDRQTNKQTSRQTHNLYNNIENNILEASFMLDSLDSIKKDIRSLFKKLTTQEMLVFSSIYQLEAESSKKSNYKEIAIKLKLSESSIRDYVQKLLKKGIPIKKLKIDNKLVVLSVSDELKKIASLSTILQLREL